MEHKRLTINTDWDATWSLLSVQDSRMLQNTERRRWVLETGTAASSPVPDDGCIGGHVVDDLGSTKQSKPLLFNQQHAEILLLLKVKIDEIMCKYTRHRYVYQINSYVKRTKTSCIAKIIRSLTRIQMSIKLT